MLKVLRNKKAQNTAEYAILIALVVGAVVAMQSYVQRGLQARTRGTSLYMRDEISNAMKAADASMAASIGNTGQYNPYYLDQQYETTRDSEETATAAPSNIVLTGTSNKSRAAAGYDATLYNGDVGATGQD
jgi:hypothetical protein